jgi:hypothetical protein
MCKVIERERTVDRPAAECSHPLALDKFDGRFGLKLRRLSCLVCGDGWWESDGTPIGATNALAVIAKLVAGPRPTGWAAAEREWQRLEEESLAPVR